MLYYATGMGLEGGKTASFSAEVIEEFSKRYGTRVQGWWLDNNVGRKDCQKLLADACPAVSGALPATSDPVTVVPDPERMPAGIVSQHAHNNLDIAWHQGRLFFAFRTGPTHFADEGIVLYVVSTTDQQSWVL